MYNVILNLNKIFIIMRNVKMKKKTIFRSGEETSHPLIWVYLNLNVKKF